MTKYLEFTARLLQLYVVIMLGICAILLAIIVYNTSDSVAKIKDLTGELHRLELIDYAENESN